MVNIVDVSHLGLSITMGTAGGTPLKSSIFGDGRDGNVDIEANTVHTIQVVEDVQIAEMNCVNLTLNAGAKITTSGRCPALIIKVQKDCVINGTIDMDKKSPLKSHNEAELAMHPVITMCGNLVGGNGGNGGGLGIYDHHGRGSNSGGGGLGGIGHVFGGGYAGGGAGSSRAGGSSETRPTVDMQWPYPGGSGMQEGAYGSGGGAKYGSAVAKGGDAPGASGASYQYDETDGVASVDVAVNGLNGDGYGGGVIYLVVGGNLTIGTDGLFTACGGKGANGVSGYRHEVNDGTGVRYTHHTGPGGGGGGGVVCIVHRGELANAGTISVLGGDPGTATSTITRAYSGEPGTELIRSFSSMLSI